VTARNQAIDKTKPTDPTRTSLQYRRNRPSRYSGTSAWKPLTSNWSIARQLLKQTSRVLTVKPYHLSQLEETVALAIARLNLSRTHMEAKAALDAGLHGNNIVKEHKRSPVEFTSPVRLRLRDKELTPNITHMACVDFSLDSHNEQCKCHEGCSLIFDSHPCRANCNHNAIRVTNYNPRIKSSWKVRPPESRTLP